MEIFADESLLQSIGLEAPRSIALAQNFQRRDLTLRPTVWTRLRWEARYV